MSMSPEIWNSLNENLRMELTNKYIHSLNIVKTFIVFDEDEQAILDIHKNIVSELEASFGKDNLLPPKKIKTWSDLKEIDKRLDPNCGNPLISIINKPYVQNIIAAKNKSAIKLAKLIDEFYGGVITEDEWVEDTMKFCVKIHHGRILAYNTQHENTLIAFHTVDERDEFLLYPENRNLVYTYFMCVNNEDD